MSERDPQPDVDVVDEDVQEAADQLGMEPVDLQGALADVERVLEDLADLDVDLEDPADLERVRKRLPGDPIPARLLHAALPMRLRETIEYVSPSDRQDGYWRRSRERRDPSALSDRELMQRWQFSQKAEEMRGLEGTVTTADGREIPRAAAAMGDDLEGEDFDPGTEDRREDRAKGLDVLRRISDLIRP